MEYENREGYQAKADHSKEEEMKNFAASVAKGILMDFKDPEKQVDIIQTIKTIIKDHYEDKMKTAHEEFEANKSRNEFIKESLK